jgi:site-specific recombinase XerD
MAKGWVDQFVEWGLSRAERPWEHGTATSYRQELAGLARFRRKRLEDFTADDLRAFQASRRKEKARTWNRRVSVIQSFFQFLSAQGYRGDDPSTVLNRRPEPKVPAKHADVLAEIARLPTERGRQIALFFYFSGLSLREALSIREPPVGEKVHVRRGAELWEWVPLSEPALGYLSKLGGRMPVRRRQIERDLEPLNPRRFNARHDEITS